MAGFLGSGSDGPKKPTRRTGPLSDIGLTVPKVNIPKLGGDQPMRTLLKLAAGIVVAVCLIIFVVGCSKGIENPEAGMIGVVREGGPIDDKQIRGLIQPGSGIAWTGLFSRTHYYPSNQRNYLVTSDRQRGDRPGVDIFGTPTKDAVHVGVEGQVLFTLNLEPKVIKELDNRYGTRTNPTIGQTGRVYPWEGDAGWGAFLDSWFRPTLDNALREEIGRFDCAQLNASCSLVRSRRSVSGTVTNVVLGQIQDRLQASLQDDLDRTLGGKFFEIQKVNIIRITLPLEVEEAVNIANAEKARVESERFKAQQAKYKSQAALSQARANRANPYAGIEQVFKALPPDSQPVINLNLGGGTGKGLNLGFNR